jgi:hypothetical protein
VPRRAFKDIKGYPNKCDLLIQGTVVVNGVIVPIETQSFHKTRTLKQVPGILHDAAPVKEWVLTDCKPILTFTSMERRQSMRTNTKGSNISRTCSLEELILEVFRLRCSS